MLLHDAGIRRAITNGNISMYPFDTNAVQPSSIDLRLGHEFAVINTSSCLILDPKVDNSERVVRYSVTVEGDYFLLQPGHFVLASTIESVRLGLNIAARVEGKSSLGRLGLLVHATAGFIDPGFEGQVTLELANLLNIPIKLYPKMPVAQICFFQMAGQATSYQVKGKYVGGQTGPTTSRYHLNFAELAL